MLRTLKNPLSFFGDMINTMSEENRNCEFLKNKIVMWEKRNKAEVSKKKTSVFKMESQNSVKCHVCGQLGHYKKNCKNSWPRNGQGGQRRAWQGDAPSQQQQQSQTGGMLVLISRVIM